MCCQLPERRPLAGPGAGDTPLARPQGFRPEISTRANPAKRALVSRVPAVKPSALAVPTWGASSSEPSEAPCAVGSPRGVSRRPRELRARCERQTRRGLPPVGLRLLAWSSEPASDPGAWRTTFPFSTEGKERRKEKGKKRGKEGRKGGRKGVSELWRTRMKRNQVMTCDQTEPRKVNPWPLCIFELAWGAGQGRRGHRRGQCTPPPAPRGASRSKDQARVLPFLPSPSRPARPAQKLDSGPGGGKAEGRGACTDLPLLSELDFQAEVWCAQGRCIQVLLRA